MLIIIGKQCNLEEEREEEREREKAGVAETAYFC